jgi:DNA-binding CsgD family transcriptional regulator
MKTELSTRELAVLRLATQGFTDDMIGRELGIEKGTVNSYWVRIRGKLGHLSRTEIVARFLQQSADAETERVSAETESRESANKILLDKANNEIDRLRKLLANEGLREA